jgi:hypothetical protein
VFDIFHLAKKKSQRLRIRGVTPGGVGWMVCVCVGGGGVRPPPNVVIFQFCRAILTTHSSGNKICNSYYIIFWKVIILGKYFDKSTKILLKTCTNFGKLVKNGMSDNFGKININLAPEMSVGHVFRPFGQAKQAHIPQAVIPKLRSCCGCCELSAELLESINQWGGIVSSCDFEQNEGKCKRFCQLCCCWVVFRPNVCDENA